MNVYICICGILNVKCICIYMHTYTLFYKIKLYNHTKAEKGLKIKHMLSIIRA